MSQMTETLDWLKQKAPHEEEYLQAVAEVCEYIVPIYNANNDYKKSNVLQRLLLPQNIMQFAIEWEDDEHCCRVNTGWRVQHNNVLGPYKGGTRFHPALNLSILKFLAFEQSFKNALTGLSLGAAKGGADFDAKNASPSEIRRFSRAYMRELYPYIGDQTDIPAGDINVSSKELGYMFAQQLKLSKEYAGNLSGKPLDLAGSELRTEATGFGLVYFVESMLNEINEKIAGLQICVSGAGNVAIHAAQKAIELGACVKTLSNSRGMFYFDKGLTPKHINFLKEQGKSEKNALKAMSQCCDGEYLKDAVPWDYEADIALPCATQNEIDSDAAKKLIKNTQIAVVEGANMPCTETAAKILSESNLLYAQGKAANAGGVILSAFEMQQNAAMRYESHSDLDQRLRKIMSNIHDACVDESKNLGKRKIDYVQGANVRAFRRLADAVLASGY